MIYGSIDQRLPYPNNLSTLLKNFCRHKLLSCNVKILKDLKCFAREHVLGDPKPKVWRVDKGIALTAGEISLFCNPPILIQKRDNVIWQISCYLGKTPADFDTSTMFNLDFNDSPVSSESRESCCAAKTQVLGRQTLCNASHLCNECLRPVVTTLWEGFCHLSALSAALNL